MSSELLEHLPEDEQDNWVSLEMNASGHARICIFGGVGEDYSNYSLPADEQGIQRAETIIAALQGWIDHLKETGQVK